MKTITISTACILAFITVIALTSCKKKITTESSTAFTLSEVMMNACKFSKVKSEIVKNETRFFGKITADNNKTAQVYPVVGGVVKNINVELGDYVKQGQMLASIQSTEVANFQKEKLDAENEVVVAEKNLEVAKDLFAGKLNSEKDVIASDKELQNAKAELERMKEVYSIYQLKAGSIYNVIAPTSGFIISKKINQNEQIRSDASEPLFSIAEINEVWALANVNESDISKVEVGFEASVKTLAFPNNIYKGKIDKVFNAIDPDTKSMKVRVKLPNLDFKLKPEMSCTVEIQYNEKNKMLAIPSSAVIFDKSKNFVMVFKNRHEIITREVSVYRQFPDITYIKSGLKENETVISKNAILIYDALND